MGKSKRVKIAGIKSNAGKLCPLLVNFEHGQVDPEAFEQFKAKIKIGLPEVDKHDREGKENSEDEGNDDGPLLKVRVKSDHLSYSSTSKNLLGVRHDPYYNQYIGLRNKKDGSMKLYQISSVTVGAKPKFPPTKNPLLLEARLNDDDNDEAAEKAKRKKHLVQEFGQTKGRRMYEQADRMQVDGDKLKEKLSKAAEKVTEESIALPNQHKPVALTPPCNRDATSIHDVYKISDMLSDHEMEKLCQASRAFAEEFSTVEAVQEGIKARKFSELLGLTLQRYVTDLSQEDNLSIAMYMEGIVKFLNMRSNDFAKGPKFLPEFIPMSIRQKIFTVFTDETRISPESRDRAACYILVLALLVNGFSLDFSVLSASIKSVKVPQLKKLANLIGANFGTDALTKRGFITLRLPLSNFDPNKVARRRK